MADRAGALKPILTAHLFPKIEGLLIELLRSVTPPEWSLPTVSPHWSVKQVGAHLLDTPLRKLSMVRDGFIAEPVRITSEADLVALIDRLNDEGVRFYERLSPAVLISLMEVASRESAEYNRSLDPFAPAAFPVSWAGEERSLNWFDTARDFTEGWHHQQQIRLAVNRPGIMTPELYHPVLDCFMRAHPFAYRTARAQAGALIQFDIAGDCGGTWYLCSERDAWRLTDEPDGELAAHTTIPQEIAWRIFTKGIDRNSAEAQTQIEGDRELGRHILGMRTIVG